MKVGTSSSGTSMWLKWLHAMFNKGIMLPPGDKTRFYANGKLYAFISLLWFSLQRILVIVSFR